MRGVNDGELLHRQRRPALLRRARASTGSRWCAPTEADFRNPGGAQERRRGGRVLQGDARAWSAASWPTRSRRTPRSSTAKASRFEGGEAVFPARLAGHLRRRSRQLGLHGLCVPRELGGMNAPVILYFLRVGAVRPRRRLGHGAPRLPRRHGDGDAALLACARARPRSIRDQGTILETRFADYIEEIVRGEAWGCMDITEPDAGCDMARAARRAASRTPTATGSSPGRRSSSPRATASTTSSSRAPRRSKDPNDPLSGPGRAVDVPRADLRGRAGRAQAHRHARAHRGEARPPRLGDGAARLRARAGACSSASAARASSTCCCS